MEESALLYSESINRLARKILFILLCLIHVRYVKAQDQDSLIAKARRFAYEHNYNKATEILKPLVAAKGDPELLVLLGRIYSWDKQADSARTILGKVISQNKSYIDAYCALSDLEFWEKKYDTALLVTRQGLLQDSTNTELLIREARILYNQSDYRQALLVIGKLQALAPGNMEARILAGQIRDKISPNRIGIKYDYVHFNKQFPDPWHYISLDYTLKHKSGTYTARINYANRFASDGIQYELEAYPVLSRRFYMYLNAAYSDNAGVFPKWKSGVSLFANLPAAFEAELGIRHLYFTSDAFIFTAAMGKYVNRFLLQARAYLSPSGQNMSSTYSLSGRYYYGIGGDNYVGLNVGAGISPDDRLINIQLNNSYQLKTYRAELTFRGAVRQLNVFTFNIALASQEYRPMTYGQMLQAGLGYIRRF